MCGMLKLPQHTFLLLAHLTFEPTLLDLDFLHESVGDKVMVGYHFLPITLSDKVTFARTGCFVNEARRFVEAAFVITDG
jgi:hypothetical protein